MKLSEIDLNYHLLIIADCEVMSNRKKIVDIVWPAICIGCGLVKPDMKRKIGREKVVSQVVESTESDRHYYWKKQKEAFTVRYSEDLHLCHDCSARMKRFQLRNILVSLLFVVAAIIVLLWAFPQIPETLGFEKLVMLYISSVTVMSIGFIGLFIIIAFMVFVEPHDAYYVQVWRSAEFNFSSAEYCQKFKEVNPTGAVVKCDYDAYTTAEFMILASVFIALLVGIYAPFFLQTLFGDIFPWLVG